MQISMVQQNTRFTVGHAEHFEYLEDYSMVQTHNINIMSIIFAYLDRFNDANTLKISSHVNHFLHTLTWHSEVQTHKIQCHMEHSCISQQSQWCKQIQKIQYFMSSIVFA